MSNIIDYINKDPKPFLKSESILDVTDFFEETKYSHFPVMEDDVYIGSISSEESSLLNDTSIISDHLYTLKGFFGETSLDLLSLLEIFAKNKTNVVPILDVDKKYIGFYTLEDIAHILNETPFLSEYGGVLVVAKESTEFTMSQIAQIIESNGLKALSILVTNISENKTEITIKLNQDVTDELIQTFRRYTYDIVNRHDEDSYIKKLQERSAYLDKYLNI